MMTTTIKRVLGLWIIILLPTLSYADVPSGIHLRHFDWHHGIWDFLKTISETHDNGSQVNYTLVQDDKGKIVGQVTMTFSDPDFNFEAGGTVSGSVKSIGAVTRMVLKAKIVATLSGDGMNLRLKANLDETLDIDKLNGWVIDTSKGKICVRGIGCQSFEEAEQYDITELWLDGAWDLILEIQSVDGKKLAGTASAILSSGRSVPLTIKGTYNANTDLATLKLKGGGGNLTIQAQAIAGQLVFQTITGKMLGQTVNFP